MTFCCLVPTNGHDRHVAVAGRPETIEHCGALYCRTGFATHGGWPIYRQES